MENEVKKPKYVMLVDPDALDLQEGFKIGSIVKVFREYEMSYTFELTKSEAWMFDKDRCINATKNTSRFYGVVNGNNHKKSS